MRIPSDRKIKDLWRTYAMPDNIRHHSLAVARVADWLARAYQEKGLEVDRSLVRAGALLHDIAKIIEIERGGEVEHPRLGAEILRQEGYPAVATLVGAHGLETIFEEPEKLIKLETRLVYYADKRVTHDRIVSLPERIGYIKKRYPRHLPAIKKAEPLLYQQERELFAPLGVGPRAVA